MFSPLALFKLEGFKILLWFVVETNLLELENCARFYFVIQYHPTFLQLQGWSVLFLCFWVVIKRSWIKCSSLKFYFGFIVIFSFWISLAICFLSLIRWIEMISLFWVCTLDLVVLSLEIIQNKLEILREIFKEILLIYFLAQDLLLSSSMEIL